MNPVEVYAQIFGACMAFLFVYWLKKKLFRKTGVDENECKAGAA